VVGLLFPFTPRPSSGARRFCFVPDVAPRAVARIVPLVKARSPFVFLFVATVSGAVAQPAEPVNLSYAKAAVVAYVEDGRSIIATIGGQESDLGENAKPGFKPANPFYRIA
jgi:hypothetical protein